MSELEKQARRIAQNETMDFDDAYVRVVYHLAESWLRQRELLRRILADGVRTGGGSVYLGELTPSQVDEIEKELAK